MSDTGRPEAQKCIGIDLRCLPTDGSTGAGVAHATRCLVDAVLHRKVAWTWKLYLPQDATFTLAARERGEKSVHEVECVRLRDATGSALRAGLRQRPCDVLFVPHGSVAPFLGVPACPWVHDAFIFDHPEWFPQSWFRRVWTTRLFGLGVRCAPHVFAVSEYTKQNVVTRFHLSPQRVSVTHEGGDMMLANLTEQELEHHRQTARQHVAFGGIRPPYLLFIGTIEPRKNIPLLIRAWKEVNRLMSKPLHLVILGRAGWRTESVMQAMLREQRQPNGAQIHHISDADDERRLQYLLGAHIAALPSWAEGFGLFALEALQAGIPLVSSLGGALPEVVGEAGMLCDPTDVSAWVHAIQRLCGDRAFRDRLSQQARVRAATFSWDHAADIVCAGLQACI